MSTFERYLALWVGLCIAVGVALGHLPPAVFQAIGSAEVAQVNLPVGADLADDGAVAPLAGTGAHRSRCAGAVGPV